MKEEPEIRKADVSTQLELPMFDEIAAGVFRDSIKHDFRSPNYTTRWSDIHEAE